MTKRVLLCDLDSPVNSGDLLGRWEFAAADGTIRDRWRVASDTDHLTDGWGESWNNVCSSSVPRAIYRIETVVPPSDDDGEYTQESVHGYATLACVKTL